MIDRVRRVRIGRLVVRDESIDRHDAAQLSRLVTEAIARGESGTALPESGVRGVAERIAGEVAGAIPSEGGAT